MLEEHRTDPDEIAFLLTSPLWAPPLFLGVILLRAASLPLSLTHNGRVCWNATRLAIFNALLTELVKKGDDQRLYRILAGVRKAVADMEARSR